MDPTGSLTKHKDGSQDMNLGLTNGVVSTSAFVDGLNKHGAYNTAGANIGVQKPGGGASVQAAHIPNVGNQVTLAANAQKMIGNDHKITAEAMHMKNYQKVGPNYSVMKAGVNYGYKDTVGVGASRTIVPIAKMHTDNLNTSINLHQTPNSSLDFSAGASRTTTPFGRGQWQPGGTLSYKRNF